MMIRIKSPIVVLLAALVFFPFGSVCIAEDDNFSKDWELTDEDYSECAIAKLFMKMETGTPVARRNAIEKLALLGPEARQFIPRIAALLPSEDWHDGEYVGSFKFQDVAGSSLRETGIEALSAFKENFVKGDDGIRREIIFETRLLGSKARELLPIFRKAYESTSKEVKPSLLSTIAVIDPDGKTALPLLLHELQHSPHKDIREKAAYWLSRDTELEPYYWNEVVPPAPWNTTHLEQANKIADGLRKAIQDPSPVVRATAVRSLATYPESMDQTISVLIPLIPVNVSDHCWFAYNARGYGAVGAASVDVLNQNLPKLLEYTINKSVSHDGSSASNLQVWNAWFATLAYRYHFWKTIDQFLYDPHSFAITVATIPKLPPEVISVLESRFHNQSDKETKSKYAIALSLQYQEIRPKYRQAIRNALAHKGISRRVTYDIIESGARRGLFIPLMIKHLKQGGPQDGVVWALEAIGPPDITVAPIVIDELEESDIVPLRMKYVERKLVRFGPDVIPLLIDALKDPQRSPRHNARCMLALGQFGPEAEIAIFELFKKLKSKFPEVRITAIETLGKIGTQPELTLPELGKRLKDPRPLVRAAALRAIASYANSRVAKSKSEASSYRNRALEYIPDLEKAVWDEFLDVQYAAIQSLASFGSEAKTSLPDLKAISRNTKSGLIKLTALDAIKAIESSSTAED